jgi:hypothetical protein
MRPSSYFLVKTALGGAEKDLKFLVPLIETEN